MLYLDCARGCLQPDLDMDDISIVTEGRVDHGSFALDIQQVFAYLTKHYFLIRLLTACELMTDGLTFNGVGPTSYDLCSV